jgi:hypothetical protein
VDLQKTLHPKWRARMTAMLRPRPLAQRCCATGPASLPDGARTSPFQAQRFQEAH